MIGKYRLKPKMITAIQWTGRNLQEVLNFTGKHPRFDEWFPAFHMYEEHVANSGNRFHIISNEGTLVCLPGDFIVKNEQGEVTNCVPDMFAEMFEVVPDEET